jgi:radical SAM superfamily enzyme YgiQ (UPF0313 family)
MPPKVILMTPPGEVIGGGLFHTSSVVPPLGLGYLAASVDKMKFDVKVMDAIAGRLKLGHACDVLAEERPDIVGVTFTTENRFDAFDLMRSVKKILPRTTIISGGPHSSLAPDDTLSGIPELDFIVRGEGEITFPELLAAISGGSVKDIDGISYRSNGRITHNRPRAFIEDIDSIPFPDYSRIDLERYGFTLNIPGKGRRRAATIITSRGCPFGCSFCATSKIWGKRCRFRSTKNIMDEILFLINRYDLDSFWILDDTFTVNRKNVERFCNEILDKGLDISWYCSIRVDAVDKDLLGLMKKAGMVFTTFGIESGSERIVNDVIGKSITIQKGRQVSEWCNELGIKRRIFFMLSFPEETREEFETTLSLIRELGGDTTLSVLRVYPGTNIESIAKTKGILPEDFSWTDNDNKYTFLRFLMGNSPVFLDEFSWFQIFKYLFMWSGSGQSYLNPFALIPALVREIKSPKDIYKLCMLGSAFLSYKCDRIFKRRQ